MEFLVFLFDLIVVRIRVSYFVFFEWVLVIIFVKFFFMWFVKELGGLIEIKWVDAVYESRSII